MTDEKIKPVALLPCCGYENTSAVYWNPFNVVVQCHNCGQVYTPTTTDLAQAEEKGRIKGMREAIEIGQGILVQETMSKHVNQNNCLIARVSMQQIVEAITRASEGK